MKSFIFWFLAICLIFSGDAGAQQIPQESSGEIVLRIEGEAIKNVLSLKSSDLQKLPRREVRAKDHDGKEYTFEGVDLREVLKFAGARFDKESQRANLTRYLLVEAADQYAVIFAFSELDPSFTDKTILLAEKRDGQLLTGNDGRWRLVVPDEKKHARWVRQVVALKIKKAN